MRTIKEKNLGVISKLVAFAIIKAMKTEKQFVFRRSLHDLK
jgi:hypothetical protein